MAQRPDERTFFLCLHLYINQPLTDNHLFTGRETGSEDDAIKQSDRREEKNLSGENMILWFISADFVLNQFCFNKVLFIGSYLGSTTTQLVFDF